jgi:hypothetical protein
MRKEKAMKIRTTLKAGGRKMTNHSERATERTGVKLQSHVKAGGKRISNHNERPTER